MRVRLPPVPVRWAIGLVLFIAVFAWYTAPNPEPISATGDPFVGRWLVNGVDPFGAEYSGSLTIRPEGDGYRLDWIITGAVVAGTGAENGGVLRVEWDSNADGRTATGTAEYRVEDGELAGTVATDGVDGAGSELGERLPGG